MVIAPYYDPLSPDVVTAYYRSVADSVELPIMLYNIPSVTGVDLQPDIVAELAQRSPNIKYVKNTSPNMAQAVQLVREVGVGTFVGWDTLALSSFVEGAGIMAVTANVIPAQLVAVYDAVQAGELQRAQLLWKEIYPLINAIDSEPFIAAVKWCLETVGCSVGLARIPASPLSEASSQRLAAMASDVLTRHRA
jgi:4-hydroxy-tetrahydrodipicolinate synthase